MRGRLSPSSPHCANLLVAAITVRDILSQIDHAAPSRIRSGVSVDTELRTIVTCRFHNNNEHHVRVGKMDDRLMDIDESLSIR